MAGEKSSLYPVQFSATLYLNREECFMDHPFSYDVIYSSRRTIAVQVSRDGRVTVRSPRSCSGAYIDSFISKNQAWIIKQLEKVRQLDEQRKKAFPHEKQPLSVRDRARYIRIARDIFTRKAEYYARIMNVTYGRISIREQKTRWGSCSSQGNLNFNWRLILAPEEVLDYVVVHELAHRREMNHSKAFYAIVESVLPDYRQPRKWLRDKGQTLWDIL